jgi:hypothetical protein
MSEPIACAAAIFCCLTASMLIVAIPLQFAGYERNLVRNEALVATQCTVQDAIVTSATCYRQCNCIRQCNRTCYINSMGVQSCSNNCHNVCQTCPYQCYNAAWRIQYSTLDHSGDTVSPPLSIVLDCGSGYASTGEAQQALNKRPLNSQFACYYDSNDVAVVVFEHYDTDGFYGAFITFYVLASVCGAFLLVMLAAYFMRNLQICANLFSPA